MTITIKEKKIRRALKAPQKICFTVFRAIYGGKKKNLRAIKCAKKKFLSRAL